MAGPTGVVKMEVRQFGKKCTRGALRRCDQVLLRSCVGARGSDSTCRGRGRWQMDGAWRKVHNGDVGDADGLPQPPIGRSQSTQSRSVFSPGVLVKKAKDREER